MSHPRIRREWFSFPGMRGRQRVSGAFEAARLAVIDPQAAAR